MELGRRWEAEWDSFFQGRAPGACGSRLAVPIALAKTVLFLLRGALSKHKCQCLLRERVRGYRLCEKQQSWLSYGFVLCDNVLLLEGFHLKA